MSVADDLLELAFDVVERLGLPICVLAWVTVLAAVISMGLVLRRKAGVRWGPALGVAALALAAHLADYFVTLHITPDLQLEANPLWRIAVKGFGLGLAKAYALTGKVMLAVLSAQLFAWYLATERAAAAPAGFLSLKPRFGSLARFFAFSFALFGPYFFYITAYNWLGYVESALYERVPSPPLAIALYFLGVSVAYVRLK